MRNTLRIIAGIGILAAAVAANATSIALESAGTWSGVDGSGNWTQSETVQPGGSITAPFAPLSTLSVQTTNGGADAVATYSDGGANTLTLDWTLSPPVFNTDSHFYSVEGSWVYASGTGSYAGQVGSGTFAVSQFNFGGGYSGTVLVGELAVPEPMSYAVFGIGLIGLVARRRKMNRAA